MKKGIMCLAIIALLASFGAVTSLPQREDKKPIVVDKLCYAEEIVEYEIDEDFEIKTEKQADETSEIVAEDEDCEDCVCICVRGQSVSSVSPDKAKIFAVIEILDTDINKSKNDNFTSFDKVVSALKDNGISEENICLDYFSCCPSYDYSNGRTLQGYMTTTNFSVNVDDIDNIKSYIDVMTENGTTGICNIQYQLSSMEEEYSNALASAFENARAKAVKLLGQENIRLVSIKEERVLSSNNICKNYFEGVSTGLMGKIEIEARVFAEFEAVKGATEV